MPLRSGNSSDGLGYVVVCLAILLTVFSVLSLLVVLKQLYIRKRRIYLLRNSSSKSSLSLPISSFAKSSASFIPSSIHTLARSVVKVQSAFFVGFFGSPLWETTLNVNPPGSLKRSSSFMCRYNSRSATQSSKSRQSRSNENEPYSMAEFGALESHSPPSSVTEVNSLPDSYLYTLSTQTTRVELPAYPTRTYASSHSRDSRRHSMPDPTSSSKANTSRRRHSSLKSVRSRRSELLFPNLRMVNSSPRLEEAPLPLSPNESSHGVSSPSESSTRSSRFSSMTLPPLPALPPMSPFSYSQASAESDSNRSYISHPYALVSSRKAAGRKLPPASLGALPLVSESTPSQECPSPSSVYSDTCVSPELIELQRVSVSSIPPVPDLSIALENLSKAPASQGNYSIFTRGGLKPKRTSSRSRKSSHIGPSPLRTMTLPELSVSNLALSTLTRPSPPSRSEPGANRPQYLSIGMGYPPRSILKNSISDRGDVTHLKSRDEAGMDMLQMLVEETRSWDSSLFTEMNDNFKSMIQTTSSPQRSDTGTGIRIGTTAVFKRMSPTPGVDIDLGMYGVGSKQLPGSPIYDERSVTGKSVRASQSFIDCGQAESEY